MKMKRIFAIVLALCLMLTLAACGGNGDTKTTTTAGDTETTTTVADGANEVVDGEGTTDANATQTTVTDKEGNLVTTTTVKGQTTRKTKNLIGVTTQTIGGSTVAGGQLAVGAPITIKEGTTPVEKGKSGNGQTFTYAYYGSSWSEKHKGWFAEFEKNYNCKMDIKGLPSDEYVAGLSAAMAGGSPYDLIFLHGFDYPSQITANVMMPLNDYITTADLWTSKSLTSGGGFSRSLMEATSLNGNIYSVAGTYLNTPAAIYYNKKIFKDAGFDGAEDPVALYKAGKWTWEKLYDMLYEIQDPSKGLYGMNTISPYADQTFVNSYGTDLAKLRNDGKLVQNLDDRQLYKAFEMLQKYSFGAHRVTDPNNPFENGQDQFLNGTTATWLYNMGQYNGLITKMNQQTYSAFGTKAQQKSNLGCVPLPIANSQGLHPIWFWIGYGVGNGASDAGRDFALAFAKYDSTVNVAMTFDEKVMPAELCQMSRDIMDKDKLIGPMGGFESSAGSFGGTMVTLSSKIAIKGANITVTLKAYEKVVQTLIDTALKA